MGLLEEDLPCCITLTRQKWLDKLRDMLDKWTEYLESGGQIDVVYTDFEKAFDKVISLNFILMRLTIVLSTG